MKWDMICRYSRVIFTMCANVVITNMGWYEWQFFTNWHWTGQYNFKNTVTVYLLKSISYTGFTRENDNLEKGPEIWSNVVKLRRLFPNQISISLFSPSLSNKLEFTFGMKYRIYMVCRYSRVIFTIVNKCDYRVA